MGKFGNIFPNQDEAVKQKIELKIELGKGREFENYHPWERGKGDGHENIPFSF